ncbi:hypothetical protein AURDEDRAFT_160373 [Auricularia subglabra TFB-10046 SS5]|nr:hypothetical protein AURDEDRAFT_160373 [Auricularia subglabra TFB-10046 SS5]
MPTAVPVDITLGASLIGLILSSIVFGVTCLQVYEYYTDNSGDKLFLRYLVAGVAVLDSLHVILISHSMYFFLVTNFGDYVRLAKVVWSLPATVAVADAIACIVQPYASHRLKDF